MISCESRLRSEPTLDLLDNSLREEVISPQVCPQARENLFGAYVRFIDYGKRMIREIPWVFPEEFEAEKSRLCDYHERQTEHAVFEYNE
ncbi:hypothetical protein SISNIDRAFT_461212 [Sistotremastrum niveocremeum HHB9708]|uniref:Uncharacterized protein n=2 Tax=Sistotremastraceae TaxID=3402574 RepID=A0A164MWS3_9AGAM|nr:hypothetical protein SISNIDRAFT_461212 [Sistotremastrum niveocremeum HHB9708]KZT32463.1 hypothetical protein SISSUDRAFT_1055498 [Sistotremastrum suecicum HHB10207 ss-3]